LEQKKSLALFLDRAAALLGDGYLRPGESFDEPDAADGTVADGTVADGDTTGAGNTDDITAAAVDTAAGDTMEGIAADIRSCRACPLGTGKTYAVPGEGADDPLVLVLGEGPGQDEDRTGRPFVGRAGQLLDRMLASIGLRREENCFIANVVKCRPPENRDPEPTEIAACAPFLRRQIGRLKPRIILCVGRIAANAALGNAEMQSIGSLRGRFYPYRAGPEGPESPVPLIATYHPSALLRNEDLKRPAWEDLKLLRSRLDALNPRRS
jgi:DNA polymerase